MIKLPPREKWFQYILGISALFIAFVAAYFSVAGISMLFSGAAISTAIMAASLELGKVVSVSFLYRYWHKTTKLLKVYLSAAILMLVVITSLGVFGWLSSAYQSSSMQYEMTQQQVSMLVEQKTAISSQLNMSKQRTDSLMSIRGDQEKRMNEALNSPILSRNPTALRQVQEQNVSLIQQTDKDISAEKEHYNVLVKETTDLDNKIFDTKTKSSKTKDIITFKFVADALGWELNSTVKWFIVVIIVVFDPLAVSLILAYNVAVFSDKKEEPVVVEPPKEEPIVAPKKMLLNEVPVSVEPTVPEVVVASTPESAQSEIPSGLRHSDILHSPQPGPHRV